MRGFGAAQVVILHQQKFPSGDTAAPSPPSLSSETASCFITVHFVRQKLPAFNSVLLDQPKLKADVRIQTVG